MEGKGRRSRAGHVTAIIVLLLCACVTLTALVIIYAVRERHVSRCLKEGPRNTSSPANTVCLSPACVEVAALYLSNMDLEADPCRDFFNYTCNGFVRKNPLGDHDLIKDLGINNIPMYTDLKLIKILESPERELYGEPSVAVGKLKDLYSACMNVSSNQRNGPGKLQQYIDSLGGWTFSGTRSDSIVDLEETAVRVHRSYSEGLFKPWVVANPFNHNHYQIRLQPSVATFPSATFYRTRARSRRRLALYISSVISLLGGDTNSSAARARIEEIINIEKTLIEMTPPESYRKNTRKTNNAKTLKEAQELMGDEFQVVKYLSLLLGRPVPEDFVILVESVGYMSGLRDILNNYTRAAVADYLVWTWVHAHVMFLSQQFVSVYETFTRRAVRFEPGTCLQMTKTYFNQVLGALYVQEHYDKRRDAEVSDMMSRLRLAFLENIDYIDWMEDVTKEKTREKVASMEQVVAYLDIHTNTEKLDRNYAYAGEVLRDDFQQSVVSLQSQFYAYQLSLLGEEQTIVNAVSELQAPFDTGATYAPYQNTILVWAGLMHYAFYDPRLPVAAKFGSLGFVVGHEVTHAFDNNGKNYDKDGNYLQWWDNRTLARFEERTKCYVDQYSQYIAAGETHINGNYTLGENIADNGAVKIAYSAYKSWLKNHGDFELEAHLPGLNLTAEQLFFVGMATPLCTVEADILSLYNVKNDVHSQARYRVIGSLSNFDRFSEAFQCPLGSRMNPEKKCSIW